ncbi:DUF3500 domain-containing protein [Verrucomicrobiales bacterium BCK34]|nr:DUF3500 domain-containing protein [Verrucomicrobiales bacterium BCK34]
MKQLFILLSALLALSVSSSSAHDAAGEMAAAAESFLQNLDDEQKAKATYKLDGPEREDWYFVPRPFEGDGVREGLPLKEMRGDQRHLAYALLSSGLSHHGFSTALQIMSLEQVLWEMEQDPKRDTLMYYVSIYGEPGSEAWGWGVEGHHLSINFTIVDGEVVSGTPIFFASNPGKVPEGSRKGLRVLADEEDVARALVTALDEEQRKKAMVMDEAPREILTEGKTKVESPGDGGIGYGDLNEAQVKLLDQLIDVYVHRLRPDVADQDLAKIEAAGMDKIVFGWAGGIKMGEPHYYRVQGPTFILEYANTQNNANHVHAAWRDFDGDFGRNVLAEHYKEHHHKKGE